MEDQDLIDSRMNGQPYQASRLAATLRRQLWREHLGLLPAQEFDASGDPNAQPPDVSLNRIDEGPENEFVIDPLGDAVWNTWTSQATGNTEAYRMLFRADPDDHIKTFEDYDNFRPRGTHKEGHLFDPYMPAKDVREKLDLIKGHLVWLPLEFLRDAEMAEPGLAVNQITEVGLIGCSYSYDCVVANCSTEYLHLSPPKEEICIHFHIYRSVLIVKDNANYIHLCNKRRVRSTYSVHPTPNPIEALSSTFVNANLPKGPSRVEK